MVARRTWSAGVAALLGTMLALVACGSGGTSASATGATGGADAGTPAAQAVAAGSVPGADWPTFGFDAQRSGVGPAHTGITMANVGRLGQPRVVHINGTVDSAPVELHGVRVNGRTRDVVIVTTTYGRTIAIDPGTGARLWEYTPSDIGDYAGSAQVNTTTPVADTGRRYVYATSPDGYVHKLSVSTGREVRSGHWPVRVTFDATKEKMDGALNLGGHSLIVVTGGYIGDAPIYQGHVVLIDRVSGRITHVFNTLCSNRRTLLDPPSSCPRSDSAIWAREGSVVEPGSHRLLIATGNGVDGQVSFNGSIYWSDSVLELSPTLQLLHNWTPPNQQQLNDSDTDLGSTAPAILPAVGGWHMAVQGGKDGRLHVLNLAALDGTHGGAGPRLGGELSEVSSPGSGQVLTSPAVWSHAGHVYVFVADDSGTAAYTAHGGRHPGLSLAWRNGTSGTSPVLAGGLLYVYDESDGALEVYSPTSGARIASLPTATGHWNSPIVVGGRIILPVGSYHDHASTGEIYIWHLRGR